VDPGRWRLLERKSPVKPEYIKPVLKLLSREEFENIVGARQKLRALGIVGDDGSDRYLYFLIKAYSIVGAIVVDMPVLATTRIGRYFRTTVPREVRKILELKENDEIEWVLENRKIVVRKRGESRG